MKKRTKNKNKNIPILLVDDSQYKDEPINRDPDTSMEISEELQAKLDEIRKQFKFWGCNRMRFYRILVAVPLKYKKYQEN